MPRFRLDIEYDGLPYAGWQRQADQPSVQQAVEEAIEKFCGEEVSLRGAGRTDAGVHATGQVAHVDLIKAWPGDTVRDALNAHLVQAGARVSIVTAMATSEDFDARFSAIARHYVYRIINRRAPPALDKGKVWWVPKRLDADAMQAAAQVLLGRHDFTTFRSSQCQASSPLRTSARSFLHNQVRSMVGSLKRVGEGAWTGKDLKAALDARSRAACGQVAPPDGLFLVKVDYP
jgi:tRNA pseudouridine38-40 synthase